MLFHVRMRVDLPTDVDPEDLTRRQREEREYARRLQHDGTWRHLWRVVGRYENVSILEAASHEELHRLLSGLPLWPWLDLEVVPLAHHPSDIHARATETPRDV